MPLSEPKKPTILVTRQIFDESIAQIARYGNVESNQGDRPFSPAQLSAKLRGKDAVVCVSTDVISDKVLAKSPQLKIVCNVAVGYNNVDVQAATRRGVMVTNTPGVLDDTTADFTWCLILATARRLIDADKTFRSGKWKGWGLVQFLGNDVHGKTLGICGFGRIGKGVARRARGFDMRVLYTDLQRVPEAVEREHGVTFVDKKTLLRQSDIVTLHVPLFPATTHYIGAPELAQMKKTAILVNASRGPVVDEKALVNALEQGRLAGAGLDVYEKEPKPARGLTMLRNTVLAPHVASASIETRRKMSNMAAANCIAGLTGQRPPNLLNPEVLDRS